MTGDKVPINGRVQPLAQAQILRAQISSIGTFGTLSWGIGEEIPATIVRPASPRWLLIWSWATGRQWQAHYLPPSDRPRCFQMNADVFLVGCALNADVSVTFRPELLPVDLFQSPPNGDEWTQIATCIDSHIKQPQSNLIAAALELAEETSIDKVGLWANALGCTERHLHRHVREQLGLRPISVLRSLRIARLASTRQTGADLATLALSAGFTDQAHMNREVLDATGLTPKQWLDHCEDLDAPWLGCYGVALSIDSQRLPTTKRRSKTRQSTSLSMS